MSYMLRVLYVTGLAQDLMVSTFEEADALLQKVEQKKGNVLIRNPDAKALILINMENVALIGTMPANEKALSNKPDLS